MKYLCVFLISIHLCQCFRILVVFPIARKSHSFLGDGVVRNLLEAGHEVTYITSYLGRMKHPKLHEVDVSDVKDYIPGHWIDLEILIQKGMQLTSSHQVTEQFNKMDVDLLQNENVQKLLNDPNQNFDVIVIEWLFSEYLSGLSAVFGCPYIWVSPYDPHWTILSLIDEPTNPAYVPDTLSSNMPPFSFTERLQELWNQWLHRMYAIRNLYILEHDKKMHEKMYGSILATKGRPLPSYTELRYNASLVLGNSHVSMGLPISLPQNYKPIGGYHIDPNLKKLPKELKIIMDEAKHGVIYFSMGTFLRGETLPQVVKKKLLQMFQTLEQTILWKLEKNIDDVPKNVHILKWAPQQSILEHYNCRLFITHGGMLSTTEAVYFGVPIIGVPMVGDQFNNINRAIRKGFAKKVDMSLNFAEELKIAILEILRDSKYAEKVKVLSALYHDRLIPPGKELVFWVEHVVRTNGALHLRSPALMVPWYQKMYLDFIAVIIICLIVTYISFKKIIKIVNNDNKSNIKKIN